MLFARGVAHVSNVYDERNGVNLSLSLSVVLALTMSWISMSSFSSSSNLKPGVYRIQNLYSGTYLDIHEHSRELCCRPLRGIEPGKGLVSPIYHPTAIISDD